MRKSVFILNLVVLFFGAYYILDTIYFNDLRKLINVRLNQIGLSHIITYALLGIPLVLGTLVITKFSSFFSAIGLKAAFFKPLLFALICTAPMFIGYALVFDFNVEVSLNHLLIGVLAAAFFEELYFRGFLFGMLYRFTRFGFIPSVFFGALLFASAHLYQSSDLGTMFGIFVTTLLGAVLFAWVYAEWKFSIWVPVFLHLFMNLSWMLFSAGDNAFGGIYANVFRIITITLIITGTLYYKKKQGLKLEVNMQTLLMKKP